jgi:hypothetical protein
MAYMQPEYPHNARMLTPMQRDLAVWRLRQEAGAGEGEEQISHTKAFVSAATDPKVRAHLPFRPVARLADPQVLMLIAMMCCSQAM